MIAECSPTHPFSWLRRPQHAAPLEVDTPERQRPVGDPLLELAALHRRLEVMAARHREATRGLAAAEARTEGLAGQLAALQVSHCETAAQRDTLQGDVRELRFELEFYTSERERLVVESGKLHEALTETEVGDSLLMCLCVLLLHFARKGGLYMKCRRVRCFYLNRLSRATWKCFCDTLRL